MQRRSAALCLPSPSCADAQACGRIPDDLVTTASLSGSDSIWRKRWDSNPRTVTRCRFSRPVPSTTRPHFRSCFNSPPGLTPGILPFAPVGPTFGRSGLFLTIQSRPVPSTTRPHFLRCAILARNTRHVSQAADFCCSSAAHSPRLFAQPLRVASSKGGRRSARKSMNTRTAGSRPRRDGNTA